MSQKSILRISSVVMGVSGLIILFATLWPIISYENISGSSKEEFVSAAVDDNENPLLVSGNEEVDYTKASNWFVGGAPKDSFVSSNISFYTVSIPRLKIENATVAIGGEDLADHLIQYPGTALPGKFGNAVIFGHSVLPIFYNPKNYLSIFSLLPTLKKGDEITINYDGITYKYEVENMFEVSPTDIQVLDQDKSDSFLTLVTCVPPGDPRKPRRLIVRARVVPLTKINENLGG
ncbi:sortase [Candidatus Woesebacteria bacterium]|nr:sortase [Candidatus Woesebacteria bacterium]